RAPGRRSDGRLPAGDRRVLARALRWGAGSRETYSGAGAGQCRDGAPRPAPGSERASPRPRAPGPARALVACRPSPLLLTGSHVLDTLYVHADESCLGNQFRNRANPGGAAGLVETWRDGSWERRDYWISEPDTTNNRMAIRSAIEVLRA